MKKLFIIAFVALGSCVLLGCNSNGAAKTETENDSVNVDSMEIVDSLEVIDSLAQDTICND